MWVCAAVHTGPHRAFNHGVHDFKMRWVERQRQMHRATSGTDIRAKALVVFHVTGWQVFGRSVVKLCKQISRQLAHGVNQHIQTTAVGHANHDFLNALGAGLMDQLVHGGNEALSAFKGETFLSNVFGVQEALKAFGGGQSLQDVFFLLSVEIGFATNRFEFFLPPTFFSLVSGVHIFST